MPPDRSNRPIAWQGRLLRPAESSMQSSQDARSVWTPVSKVYPIQPLSATSGRKNLNVFNVSTGFKSRRGRLIPPGFFGEKPRPSP